MPISPELPELPSPRKYAKLQTVFTNLLLGIAATWPPARYYPLPALHLNPGLAPLRRPSIRVTAAVERLFVVEVALNEEHPSEDVESSWDRHRMVEVASVVTSKVSTVVSEMG